MVEGRVFYKKMKTSIRKKVLEKRNNKKSEDLVRKSNQIKKRLFELEEFKSSKTVVFYVSINREVFTHDMIKEAIKTKRVVVPTINLKQKKLELSELKSFDHLAPSTFGILEPKKEFIKPIKLEDVDLIIVPGIAFDKKGNRVGYGKGYFDRLLEKTKAPIVALGYDFQIVPSIECSHHDVRVNKIVTESRTINCR